MNKILALAAVATMALTPVVASAQSQYYRPGPQGWQRDYYGHNRDYRDHRDHRDYRRWERGQRFDGYRNRSYIITDYGRYGYRAPPRGYAYYRTDTGDVIMAAIATGIIASVIAGALNDNDRDDYRPAPRGYDYYGRPYY